MRRLLHDAWWRLATRSHPRSFAENLLGSALKGGAFLYRLAVGARNKAYDRGWLPQERLSCPVLSVGNLTVGGTGKTACVELLTSKLKERGRRVAILSRGYGDRIRKPYWLLSQKGQLLLNGQPHVVWDGVADEPHLLARHLSDVPIMVGARRERTGRRACEQFQVDVVILDDGLQYRRLIRDCEVVLVNARMPLGGWPLLPCGPMREPLESLRRAHVIVITKADQSLDVLAALQERLRALNADAILATAIHEPVGLYDAVSEEPIGLDCLERARVSLISSIGDPEGFEHTARQMGATVLSHTSFPDHHRYQLSDWQSALRDAEALRACALLTTEKDFVRLRALHEIQEGKHAPVWVLQIRMRLLSGERPLDDRLAGVCAC